MSTVLVVSPHPDDEALGVGGTLVKHVARGDRTHVIFLTSGEQGGHGRQPRETRRIREAEAVRAAAILGTSELEFWREPDGALELSGRLIKRLESRISELLPHTIFAPHAAEQHPDHATTARIVRVAARASGSNRLLGYEVWTPLQTMDQIEDITAEMQRKLEAIREYRSQCAVLGFDAAFEGLARYRGEMHSWPGGSFAEAFADVSRDLGP